MASISDLDYTDNMAANKRPFLTDLRETLDSIETYVNEKVKDNLVQLVSDSYPSGYAFDDDGAAQYTSNLYDKTTATDTYTGGNVTIAATGAWTDVDTTNAAITITPELAGDFRTTFQFVVESVTSDASNATDVRFRLTDGSTNSDYLPRIKLITGVTSTTNTVPVSLSHVFDSWSAAAKTVKLQYYISTSTNTTIKVYANSNDPICMKAEKI